jgi:hypothetical protein
VTATDDPRIPAALRPAPRPVAPPASGTDPLRSCVFTTIALLAWVAGPVVVTLLAALGLAAYVGAARRGQHRSRCVLRFVPLVILYLAAALAAGVVGVVRWFG